MLMPSSFLAIEAFIAEIRTRAYSAFISSANNNKKPLLVGSEILKGRSMAMPQFVKIAA